MINTTVSYLLGLALAALGTIHALPLISTAATGNWTLAGLFFASLVVTVFFAGSFIVMAQGRLEPANRMQFIMLITSVWVLVPLVGALPFYTSGILTNPVHAYFEAISGLTTTGATTIGDLDAVPPALILWRSSLQWLGGLFTILTVLLMLAPFGISGAPDNVHIPGYEGGDLVKSAKLVSMSLLPVYAALTSACLLALWAAGLPLFDAINIAFSTISTGGFMPRNGSLDIYQAPYAYVVLGVFMIIGATSILAHRAHLRRHYVGGHNENPETWILLAFCAGLGVVLSVYFAVHGAENSQADWMDAIAAGMFRAISLVTTTGYSIKTAEFAQIPFVIALVVCFVGGAAFSTAGGIKLFRAMLMMRQGKREMERLIHPHGITQARSTGRLIDIQLMKSIWVLSFVYLATAAAIALVLSLEGLTFETSLMAAVAAMSNVGPALHMSVAAGSGVTDYAVMSPLSLLMLIVGMVMGRVELLVLFSIGSVAYWRT